MSVIVSPNLSQPARNSVLHAAPRYTVDGAIRLGIGPPSEYEGNLIIMIICSRLVIGDARYWNDWHIGSLGWGRGNMRCGR